MLPSTRIAHTQLGETFMTIHSLLTPENSTMILIDHQPQMTFGVASIDRSPTVGE